MNDLTGFEPTVRGRAGVASLGAACAEVLVYAPALEGIAVVGNDTDVHWKLDGRGGKLDPGRYSIPTGSDR